jgi:competence protein ComEC
VISTPTFGQRDLPGMRKTLSALESRGLAVEVVSTGKRWDEDGVSFEVLHPPTVGPAKNENARSLVLLVKHGDWSMLLTGDLEGEGLTRVLALPPPRIDVLMAPHHGSETSNNADLAKWARPKLVVSCQAEPKSERASVRMYEKMGAKFLGTWPHGAITIRPSQMDAAVETFRTKVVFGPF